MKRIGGLLVILAVCYIIVIGRDADLALKVGGPVVTGLLIKGAYRQAGNGSGK